jgi:hypothetical protein
MPAEVVQLVARHADYETTKRYYLGSDVQKAAATLRSAVQDVPRYNQPVEST